MPTKTENQLRRARTIMAKFEEHFGHVAWVDIKILAEAMTEDQWAEWGTLVCGFDNPPSHDTRVMVLAMIDQRIENDANWDRLNKGNQDLWES
jgi:hypothetical protein